MNLKTLFFFLLTTFASTSLPGQDVLDKIAEDCCVCIKEIDIEGKSDEQVQMALGLCIIQEAAPYEKELKKKYDIDFSEIHAGAGEQLGELVGLKLAGTCPEFFDLVGGVAFEDEAEEVFEAELISLTGNIQKIEEDQFLTVHVKDSEGKVHKMLWLEYFPNSDQLLSDLNSVRNQEAVVYYTEKEFYEPRLNDYIKFKVIRSVEF